MSMSQVSESDLERMRELVKAAPVDPLALREWVIKAKLDMSALIEDLTDRQMATGGGFSDRLREALEPQILTAINGRAALTSKTEQHSLSVHLTQDAVFVDVRLRLGVGK